MRTKLSLWITLAILGLLVFSLLAPPINSTQAEGILHPRCERLSPHLDQLSTHERGTQSIIESEAVSGR